MRCYVYFFCLLLFVTCATSVLADEPAPVFNVDGGIAVGGEGIVDENGMWVGDPTGIQGPQGEPGPQGPQGIQGPAGPVGAGIDCDWSGWRIVESSLGCSDGCASYYPYFKLYCSGGTITQARTVNVCKSCKQSK